MNLSDSGEYRFKPLHRERLRIPTVDATSCDDEYGPCIVCAICAHKKFLVHILCHLKCGQNTERLKGMQVPIC